MKSLTPYRLWALVLGLSFACAKAEHAPSSGRDADGSNAGDDLSPELGATRLAATAAFPGAGTSGAAQPLSALLAPETSGLCDPEPVASEAPTISEVETVCFYAADEPDVPAALIEQVVEIVGNREWVHMRLTLNPDFVDNTYGDNAIGWGDAEAAPEPPAAPDAGATPPEPPAPPADAGATPPEPPAPRGDGAAPREPRAPRGERPVAGGRGPGKGGHTFRDLLGSDHAEIQLLDADGNLATHFRIDYLSASEDAASGFASLGVSGGEGKLIVGEPEWVLATTTSLDRNLNGCGLGSFIESSPATDEQYTPNPDASDWDYRVAYEIWVSAEAFGTAGFGSALIENVHASPSKLANNTVDVSPAPCPVDPDVPGAVAQPVPDVLQNIR